MNEPKVGDKFMSNGFEFVVVKVERGRFGKVTYRPMRPSQCRESIVVYAKDGFGTLSCPLACVRDWDHDVDHEWEAPTDGSELSDLGKKWALIREQVVKV